MDMPLYTNYEAKQKSDLDWMTDKETEILTRYLLTSGPRAGIPAIKEGDIIFRTGENPGKVSGYVPLTDLRTPGNYDHPMNLALDTTNKGSKYLYLYIKMVTGEKKAEAAEVKDEKDKTAPTAAETADEKKTDVNNVKDEKDKTTPAAAETADGKKTDTNNVKDDKDKAASATVESVNHVYTKKQYVIAMVCGVGRNPETAISNLYSNAASMWAELAKNNSDIDAKPLFTQLDEIIPVDLSSEHPWYELHLNDTNELNIATEIQTGMLPSIFPAFPDRPEFDIHASMDPAKEVGGDFYDFFMIDDDHLAMVIADVSGKGVPAALFMMSSKILINDHAIIGGSPAEILERVNKQVCSNNEAHMFVTVLEISTGLLTTASAGHEYPIINIFFGQGNQFLKFTAGSITKLQFKFSGFRKGSRGRSLFPPEKGLPRVTCRPKLISVFYGTDHLLNSKKFIFSKPVGNGIVHIYMNANTRNKTAIKRTAILLFIFLKVLTIPSRNSVSEYMTVTSR